MAVTAHHLAVTAADPQTSATFYDALLGALGYRREHAGNPLIYTGPGPEFLVYAVEGDDTARHRHGAPGLQHIGLQVDNPDTVDAAHRAAAGVGGTVVHPPRPFDYMDGYYATFVEDPDGSRIEILHIPAPANDTQAQPA